MNEVPEIRPRNSDLGAVTRSDALPAHYASQLSISMNVADLSVTFGQLRQLLDPATGAPSERAGLEWLFTVALPPPTARALAEGLKFALEEFERRYGTIPRDTTASIAQVGERQAE